MVSSEVNPTNERSDQWSVKVFALGVCIGAIALFGSSLGRALALSYADDRYLQIIATPLIAAYLIYWDRDNIFSRSAYNPRLGFPLLSLGVILCLIAAIRPWSAEPIIGVVPIIASLVALIEGAFILCFGVQSFKAAAYSMGCLWLAVPIPPSVIDALTTAYQHGSAAVSLMLLELAGVSVFRSETSFSIPGLDFTIAPECSGIRSGLAFVMVGILAGRLYLRSGWGRSILILSTIPIAMFKNAIRIVVTTSLAAYVDRWFIDGPFHHKYGGIIFSPLDFLLFVPLLLGLRKLEKLTSQEMMGVSQTGENVPIETGDIVGS